MSKYGSKKSIASDGAVCDSKREARRYEELLMLQKIGAIERLERQVKYDLLPSQSINGKVVERAASYTADFRYFDRERNCLVVEDAKGMRTQQYVLRRKLMLYYYGIQIREV